MLGSGRVLSYWEGRECLAYCSLWVHRRRPMKARGKGNSSRMRTVLAWRWPSTRISVLYSMALLTSATENTDATTCIYVHSNSRAWSRCCFPINMGPPAQKWLWFPCGLRFTLKNRHPCRRVFSACAYEVCACVLASCCCSEDCSHCNYFGGQIEGSSD